MSELLEHLKSVKFEKQLKKLNRKMKNKTIVIYGTGLLFQEILRNYDLSNLNIIGVSDRKYSLSDENKKELGFNIIPLERIYDYHPDYILISTLKFLNIIDEFRNTLFKNSGIKILPLVDKPFFELLKEIFH